MQRYWDKLQRGRWEHVAKTITQLNTMVWANPDLKSDAFILRRRLIDVYSSYEDFLERSIEDFLIEQDGQWIMDVARMMEQYRDRVKAVEDMVAEVEIAYKNQFVNGRTD